MIVPAGKGNASVILGSVVYVTQMEEILNDSVYLMTTKDSTKQTEIKQSGLPDAVSNHTM